MSDLNPITLQVKNLRRTATRMSVSIGIAVLAMATLVPVSSASSSDVTPPDMTALIIGGTTVPTPDAAFIDVVIPEGAGFCQVVGDQGRCCFSASV